MIEVRGLSKRFGRTQVLTDISADCQKGKVNQIIGKSGSGKSVLCKCIVGLFEPEEGEVLYDGRSFHHLEKEEKRQVRQEIGMLFQSSALFDSLTVLENVLFPLRMFATMPEREMLDRARLCLKRVDIEGKDALFPAQISGGMQKRVGIARAIALPHHDELAAEEYGMTTIVITHDMNSVMGSGDNILFIHEGRAWWKGTREELLKSDNKELNDFIFAGSLMRMVKDTMKQ